MKIPEINPREPKSNIFPALLIAYIGAVVCRVIEFFQQQP